MIGLKIKEVDSFVIAEVVRRIVESVCPEKIVLFGSYAYGEPGEHSDLDILVVMESDLPRYKRSVPIYRALADLLIPIDILVYTPEEIEDWKEVPQAFITSVLSKGKVIYEKSKKDQDLLTLKDEVVLLTPYAVETRYPEFEEPLLDDAKESVSIAEKVRDFILGKLPEEVKGGDPR